MVQVQKFGIGTRYQLEHLHQCGKSVKNKSQKVLGANSYVYRSYRRKTGREAFLFPSPSRVGLIITSIIKYNQKLLPTKKSKWFKNISKKTIFFIILFYIKVIFLSDESTLLPDALFLLCKVCNKGFDQGSTKILKPFLLHTIVWKGYCYKIIKVLRLNHS